MKKNVLIIAGQTMVAEFLLTFLEQRYRNFTVCRCASIKEVRELLRSLCFDLVLTDIGNVDSVVSIIKEITLISPKTRCLVLSSEANAIWAQKAMRAGAGGILTKNCPSEEILEAVNTVFQGRKHLSSDVLQSLADFTLGAQMVNLHGVLSPREFEVFLQIGQGKALKVIGHDLNLSPRTVAVHKFNIGKKTGITSIGKIVRYCVEYGLLGRAA